MEENRSEQLALVILDTLIREAIVSNRFTIIEITKVDFYDNSTTHIYINFIGLFEALDSKIESFRIVFCTVITDSGYWWYALDNLTKRINLYTGYISKYKYLAIMEEIHDLIKELNYEHRDE